MSDSEEMKKISIVIACYNEEGNVIPLCDEIEKIFREKLNKYDYEILFMDNSSTDNTQKNLQYLCEHNSRVKAIFNVKNFGSIRSSVYGILQATGNCVIKMCADFQDPPSLIIDFIREWENDSRLVLGIKNATKEKIVMSFFRKSYYRIIGKIVEIDHINNFVGYGLYDRKFVEILRDINDPMPYLRGIVAELGYKYSAVYYNQPKRKSGKSKYNFYRLYDYAMLGITSYSKIPLRIATLFGFVTSILSAIAAMVYTIMKIVWWDKFPVGMAPVVIGVFFLGALQLFFIGLLGEYIININTRVLNRPLVIEEKRIGF